MISLHLSQRGNLKGHESILKATKTQDYLKETTLCKLCLMSKRGQIKRCRPTFIRKHQRECTSQRQNRVLRQAVRLFHLHRDQYGEQRKETIKNMELTDLPTCCTCRRSHGELAIIQERRCARALCNIYIVWTRAAAALLFLRRAAEGGTEDGYIQGFCQQSFEK